MSVPQHIRENLRRRLWRMADDINWSALPTLDRSRYYESWARDDSIGGVLARYMDAGGVRLYLKDAIFKNYGRQRLADDSRPLRLLGLAGTDGVVEVYTKPHGRRLRDGRVICWGRADGWKAVLMAMHERAFAGQNTWPFAVMLMQPVGRFSEDDTRKMVENAATKLGIKCLIWLD